MLKDRARLFAFAGILCALNGSADRIIDQVVAGDPLGVAANLFGVSAVVWLALLIAERISVVEGSAEPASAVDYAIAAAMLVASVVPIAAGGSLALSAGAFWLVATSTRGSRGRRLGVVLFAISITLIWGRLGLAIFGPSLLALDGGLVSLIAGTPHQGNLVFFTGGSDAFVIGAPCSSVHNVTLATLLWTAVSQYLRIPVNVRWVGICAAATAAVILVNALRLASIALYPANFDTLHDGGLAQAFGMASLCAAAAVVLVAVRNVPTRAI